MNSESRSEVGVVGSKGGQTPVESVSLPPERLVRFARVIGALIPDAMSAAVTMMVILGVVALAVGNPAATVAEAYYKGLWMLLPFTMQMTLIVVLSSTLGAASIFKRIIARLATLPRNPAQVFALACVAVAALAYLYWGLSLALAPIIAISFAREAEKKGVAVDFPFLLATVVAAASVWQFGLSATAPLQMNTSGHFLEKETGLMPLSTTIWAPASLAFVGLFLVAIIIAARCLAPRRPEPVSAFPDACRQAELAATTDAEPVQAPATETISDRIEGSAFPQRVLAGMLAGWLYYHFFVKGLGLDLNSLNAALLALAVLVHGSVRNFNGALQTAILTCWPVVVMYQLYGAVAGLIQFTSIGKQFAGAFAAMSTQFTFPFLTALASTIVAVFVPSSGGQWVIQGLVTSQAAAAVGVSAQRGLLALSVGDQMGNLVSPFWVVLTAGLARIDFRRFIGYQFAYAAIWFVLGVVVFTFLPA